MALSGIKHAVASGERRIAITIVGGLLISAATYQFFLVPQQHAHEEAEERLELATSALNEVEGRIAAVQSGSSDSIVVHYDKARTLDILLPSEPNVGQFEVDLPAMLEQHGLETTGLNRGASQTQGNGLAATPYTLKITGTHAGLLSFLDELQRYPRLVTTDLSGITAARGDAKVATAITLHVWHSELEELPPKDDEKPGELPYDIFAGR